MLLFFTVLFSPFVTYSQHCNCEKNFAWVKETFEKNDAGFQHVLQQQGQEAYEQHNKIYADKVKPVTDLNECVRILYEWVKFFRSGHIKFKILSPAAETPHPRQSRNADLAGRDKNREKLDLDVARFLSDSKTTKATGYEGIWKLPPYKIGIKKVEDDYVGFIIEGDDIFWTKNQVKLRIHQDGSGVFYRRDHSPQKFSSACRMGNNYLEIGSTILERDNPQTKTAEDMEADKYVQRMQAQRPFLESVNEHTLYFRIPSFSFSQKKYIDSIIVANYEKITQTPNLIIDLRYNDGGSDKSFESLLPLIYTNPIRTIGVEFLSTPTNNQRMLDFANDTVYGFDSEFKLFAKNSYEKLSRQPGAFVNLDSTLVSITTLNNRLVFPQQVGIIIHGENASTAEQFLLAAKQSKKVKLFGTITAGVLDISNMYFVQSPCGEFELGYALSRSRRIPEMTIDEKGIQPDYYLDHTIPKHKWLDVVVKIVSDH